MKFSVEVDVEPEELRRLLGLPDTTQFWDSINKRIEDGDSEFALEMLKSFVGEGIKTSEYLAKFVKGFRMFQSNSEREEPTEEPTRKSKPTTRKRTKKSS